MRKQYTYHKIPFKILTQRDLIFHSAIAKSMMQTEARRFDQHLDKIFEAYERKFLPELYNWHMGRLLSIEIELETFNECTVPSEHIDLLLRFPGVMNIELAETFNPFPVPPVPPDKPLPLDELLSKANDLRKSVPSQMVSSRSLPKPWVSIQKVDAGFCLRQRQSSRTR